VTLWQTVIYFVYKLSLNYHSFKAIAGCPPDSSFSRTVHQHTQRTVHRTGCGPAVQISSQKTNGLQICRIQTQWTITCGVQCWRLTASLPVKQSWKQSPYSRKRFSYLRQPTTRTNRQGCERLLKLSDWRLVLELGAVGGHFEHSQWWWKSGIWY